MYLSSFLRFFACSLRGGGGPVLVWNFGKYGNVNKGGIKPGLINGHKDAGSSTFFISLFCRIKTNMSFCIHPLVLDTAFNPFHPNVLATGSLDASICIWGIPEGGMKGNTQTKVSLEVGVVVGVVCKACRFHLPMYISRTLLSD